MNGLLFDLIWLKIKLLIVQVPEVDVNPVYLVVLRISYDQARSHNPNMHIMVLIRDESSIFKCPIMSSRLIIIILLFLLNVDWILFFFKMLPIELKLMKPKSANLASHQLEIPLSVQLRGLGHPF